MAYRVTFNIDDQAIARLRDLKSRAAAVVAPIVSESLDVVKEYMVQNLSGVPFTSKTGTWTINKRTGRGAAAVQVQYPYGSPFRGRIFASVMTSYGGNPESYNYLDILERGRGEIVPKYTPSMQSGNPQNARLTIPGGSHNLVFGQSGFRGISGRYRFVKRIPPMEGRYWAEAAVASAQDDVQAIADSHIKTWMSGI